jgi:hypothetical protein
MLHVLIDQQIKLNKLVLLLNSFLSDGTGEALLLVLLPTSQAYVTLTLTLEKYANGV